MFFDDILNNLENDILPEEPLTQASPSSDEGAAFDTAVLGDPADEFADLAPPSSDNSNIGGFEEDVPMKPAEGGSGDILLHNLILLFRDLLRYFELRSAIHDGDIGRVFEVIKVSIGAIIEEQDDLNDVF